MTEFLVGLLAVTFWLVVAIVAALVTVYIIVPYPEFSIVVLSLITLLPLIYKIGQEITKHD